MVGDGVVKVLREINGVKVKRRNRWKKRDGNGGWGATYGTSQDGLTFTRPSTLQFGGQRDFACFSSLRGSELGVEASDGQEDVTDADHGDW